MYINKGGREEMFFLASFYDVINECSTENMTIAKPIWFAITFS